MKRIQSQRDKIAFETEMKAVKKVSDLEKIEEARKKNL